MKNRKKHVWLWIVIVVLVIALAGVGGYLYWYSHRDRSAYEQYQFDTEAMAGRINRMTEAEIQDELDRVVDEGMFNISIASAIVVDSKTNQGTANIENIAANRYYMQVDIFQDETGERLYSSKLIKPGFSIPTIQLEKALEPGAYPATAIFSAITQDEMKDLQGQRFGKLLVVSEAGSERAGGCRWLCRCDCGKECVVSARSLQTGKRTSCGCDSRKGKHRLRDVTGQRFGMLTALYPTKARRQQGSVVWHCRCDCGKEVDVPLDRMQSGAVSSCGCMREQCNKALAKTLVHVAGTSIDLLRSERRRSDNQTGVTGVYRKRGRFTAEIRFQGKEFYLGSYEKLTDAALVRRRAEEELHKSTVRFYDAWKKRAELNPAWAQENPIRIRVERHEDGEFNVRMFPEIPY